MADKPKFEEYINWMQQTNSINLNDPKFKIYYELNASRILTTSQQHKFFSKIDDFLEKSTGHYNKKGNFGLIMGKNELQLVTKPFESIINKSYRRNILLNDRFPDCPSDGWCLPENWFTKLNDVTRGTIVTKYIDGPEFLSKRLGEQAQSFELDSTASSRESDSGYYAYHFYVSLPVEIAQVNMEPLQISSEIEIQITTQLQEILKKLTHGLYEELRIDPNQDARAWKWDFQSSRFQASYLGHTLHLLEGVIVQLKERASKKNDSAAD